MRFAVRPPNKRRLSDALHRRESEEISYYEPEFHPSIVSAILDKPISGRSYMMPVADYVEFAHRVGLDVCRFTVPWWLGREKYVDEKGMVRYKAGTMSTDSDLRHLEPPDLSTAKRRIEEFLQAAEGSGLGWVLSLPGAPTNVLMAMGYQNYYLGIYDDPGFVEEFLDRVEEHTFAVTEALLSYEPDAAELGAICCFKTGLAMSAPHVERFIISRLDKHMRLLRAAGIPVIIHSDGDNRPVIDRWIELGFAAFHPVEPGEEYDIYEYKKRWGDKIALCGNIDCATVLSKGTPEEVARDTLEHLESLSPGGGYICGSSHDIDENVPVENLRAMAETVAQYKHKIGSPMN